MTKHEAVTGLALGARGGSIGAAALLVRSLEAMGVERIYAVPGEENLDVLEALRTSSVRVVVARHEQAAGFMAATEGRLSGRAGVVLSTLGPGATNLATAAAYATLGGMPVVLITGQKAVKTARAPRFQVVDVPSMMRPITKRARSITVAASIPHAVREAFAAAEEGWPGAVHLELPEDVARETVTGAVVSPRAPRIASVADPGAVSSIAAALASARSPIVVFGGGAARGGGAGARALVEKGIPFATTPMGKGAVDEAHAGYLGTTATTDAEAVHGEIAAADVVLCAGLGVAERPAFVPRDGQLVASVEVARAPSDAAVPAGLEAVGDVDATLLAIAAALRPREPPSIRTAAPSDAWRASAPLSPERLVEEIRRAVPEDGTVCLDNGQYKVAFARGFVARAPGSLLLDNALATMGAGLPSAVGAKIAHPERAVVAVVGDGGFLMNSQELETAAREGADVVVVIARDDAYGMIKKKQAAMGFPAFATAFGNPDFVRFAEAYGAKGHRAGGEGGGSVGAIVAAALAAGGVHVVDAQIEYETSVRSSPCTEASEGTR